jgi:hypothetical protein
MYSRSRSGVKKQGGPVVRSEEQPILLRDLQGMPLIQALVRLRLDQGNFVFFMFFVFLKIRKNLLQVVGSHTLIEEAASSLLKKITGCGT